MNSTQKMRTLAELEFLVIELEFKGKNIDGQTEKFPLFFGVVLNIVGRHMKKKVS